MFPTKLEFAYELRNSGHAVTQAAIVAREDGGGDHWLMGYGVVAPGAAVPEDAGLAGLHGRVPLPKEKVPSAFVGLESLGVS